MSVRLTQLFLFVLVGLLLFGNPKQRLEDLGKGIRAFREQVKSDDKDKTKD